MPRQGSRREDLRYERMAVALEASGDYRILRRMRFHRGWSEREGTKRRAVFIDTETTGLDRRRDEIIELAIVPFDYSPTDSAIVGVGTAFSSFGDPGRPIPPDIVALTGISDEMVRGTEIDADAVTALAESADLVVAHHAAFDRPFLERRWPVFANRPWACTLNEIDWRAEGIDGRRLGQIAAEFGFFFRGHRAEDDCRAGIEILSRRLPRSGRTVLGALLDSARSPSFRIFAEGAPYDLKHLLKSRRYRWNSGEEGGRRSWFIDVAEGRLDEEMRFLKEEIYGRDVDIPTLRMTAYERHADR